MIGSIIGWTLLSLLALLILVLVLPMVLVADYRNEAFVLKVWFLGIPFRLLPPPENKKATKKNLEKEEESKEEKDKKPATKRSVEDWAKIIEQIAVASGAGLRFFFRRLRFRSVELVLPVRGEDAAETALNYAKTQGVVGGIRAFLENFINIRYKRLKLIPDFGEQYTDKDIVFACKMIASPAIILITGIIALHKFATFNDFLRRALFGKPKARRPAGKPPQNPATPPRPNGAPNNTKKADEQRSV